MELLSEIKGIGLVCEYFIKSTLLLAFSLLIVFLSRRKSASLRHFLLSLSLISLLLFPILSSITPGWETRLIPSWEAWKNSSSILNAREKSRQNSLQGNHEALSLQQNGRRPLGAVKAHSANRASVLSKIADNKNILGLSLIVLWSSVLTFLLTRILLGLCGAYRLTRQGEKISDSPWQRLLHRLLKAISLKRKVSLLSHKKVNVPITWGIIKPVVIMPDESRKWTKGQCSSALFHELSHIKRGDFLIKILTRISCAIFWFNPLSWLAFRMLKKEQEKACDELVLKAGVRPSTYAANLLSIRRSRQAHWNPPAAVLGAVGKSQLNERLVAILKKQFKPKEVKMKTKIILTFLVILAITIIGLARPSPTAAFSEKTVLSKDISLAGIHHPNQEKNVQEKQEKKKKSGKADKKESKEKKDKEKKITWVTKEGKSGCVEVHIIKGDEIKKINLEGKTITIINKDVPEKTYTLKVGGKEITIKKDEEGHWTIRGDKLEIVKGDKAKFIKISKGDALWIITEDKKDGCKTLIVGTPYVFISKDKKGHKSFTIHLKGDKGETKELFIAPHVHMHPDIHLELKHEKLKEKIKRIKEKLKKIKEEVGAESQAEINAKTLQELDEVLEELTEEIEKESKKLKDINISIHVDPKIKLKHYIKGIKKLKDHFTLVDIKGEDKVIGIIDKDNGIQITIKTSLDKEHKEKYEKILKKLKENLPESYKVESEIDEETNTFIIKISGIKNDKEQKDNMKKLIKEIIGKISKAKGKTTQAEKKVRKV